MKKKSISLFLAGIVVVVYMVSRVSVGNNNFSSLSFYPDYTDSTLVEHLYYSLVYNEQHEQADWVGYLVKPEFLESNFERRNIFREDTLVISETATNGDYYRSGFDRGHLVPAGDMTFDSIALEESFYYSNISPQLAGFNRGVWRSLETHVRNLVDSYDSLFVFTGPVFAFDTDAIGDNTVSVPVSFYKIIIKFRARDVSTSAYLIPHEQGLPAYENFRVSIDSIEAVTGLNFLNGLPDKLENRLER